MPSRRHFFPLCALLATLATFAAEPRDPVKLANELCAGCHGPNLVGGTAPNLLDTVWKHGGDDASILGSIRTGFPEAGMPGFGAALTEPELTAMLAHLRQLGRQFGLGLIPVTLPVAPSITMTSERHTFRLETFVEPLDTPWGIVFLPDGRMLVSDRIGELRVVDHGVLQAAPIRGTPRPFVKQDGGYLDLIAHPDYARNGWLYLAYTEHGRDGVTSMTVVVRGRIRDGAWVDQQDIFRADPKFYYDDTSHYGCRFLFDPAGNLFFTIGDRGNSPGAQDLGNPCGKIHRIRDDGTIPPDNPFVGKRGALGSVWSYGHRHVQGLQYHPATGKLWATEHGPSGGDELNRIEPGHNYGWPVVSAGTDRRFTFEATHAGMDLPLATWTPSIAPAAIEFYHSDRYPRWKDNLFIASLVGRQLRRLETNGDRVVHQEILFTELGRVRDVVVVPDGLLYLAMNNPGRIARLVPAD
jgi:aldose sugar dehydrogenase